MIKEKYTSVIVLIKKLFSLYLTQKQTKVLGGFMNVVPH